MGHAITEAATGHAGRPTGDRVVIKNTALKPRRVVKTGAPTVQGARPGRNEGVEWLHRPTSEHVFEDLPPEAAPAEPRRPVWPFVAAAVVAGGVAALVAVL